MRRLRRLAGERGFALWERPDLTRAAVRDEVLSLARPDAVLSWFWTRKLPRAVIDAAARGAFGVHPSLLPRWRGADPYFWAIRSGDRTTGVTAHRLDEEYDTGAIIASEQLAIDDDDDAWTLARKLDRPSLRLLRSIAARLAAGEKLEGVPQDEAHATAAPAPGEDDCTVRWDREADDVVRLVRAASPAPGAVAEIGDVAATLVRARRTDRVPRALVPGEAVWTREGVVVRAADAGVVLVRVAIDDGRDGETVLDGEDIATLLPGIADVRSTM